jgi:hypothetical protein
MLNRRVPSRGLIAALIALMVQLAIGAMVSPSGAFGTTASGDSTLAALGAAPICHADSDGSGTPAPAHLPDCLSCPLCVAVHTPFASPPSASVALLAPPAPPSGRPALPPEATAPPAPNWPAVQPRAPPTFS